MTIVNKGLNKRGHLVLVVSFSLLFCFGACNKKQNVNLSGLKVYADTLTIDIPSFTSSNLAKPVVWQEGQIEYLAAYNYLDHSLSIFNLTDETYAKRISLDREGPHFVDAVGAVSFDVDLNCFIVVNYQWITFINLEGKVLKRLRMNSGKQNDLEGIDFEKYELYYNHYSGLQFDQESKKFLMGVASLNRRYPQRDTTSRLAEIDLRSNAIAPLDIKMPKDFTELPGDYGELTRIGFWRKGSEIVFNFVMAAKVFIKESDSLMVYDIESPLLDNLAQPMKGGGNWNQNRIKHQLSSQAFYPMVSDKHQDIYGQVQKTDSNSPSDEDYYGLFFYDEHLNLISEIEFPENYYIFPIVSKRGLMFMSFNKHDDKLKLVKYNLQ